MKDITDDTWRSGLHALHCREDRCVFGCSCPCHRGEDMGPGAGKAINGHDVAHQEPQHGTPFDLLVSGTLQAPPYAGDCGLDLVTAKDAVLHVGHWVDIPCGVAVAMPPGTFGWICARSSTWVKHGLIVIPGVIDEGWRGELFTMAYRPPNNTLAHSQMDGFIPAGTRLAQLIVLPNLLQMTRLIPVDTLPASERGQRGFGSSGT